MRRVTQIQAPPDTRRRALRPALLAAFAAAALVVGAFVWSAPRDDVPVPGPDATPEQVVRAYIDAVNARDFDTANSIDATPGDDLGRFSRPMQSHDVKMGKTVTEGALAHVLFTADFGGGDGTVEDGLWGYYLERGPDRLWHIIDAGVA
jgi:hypothetical protein